MKQHFRQGAFIFLVINMIGFSVALFLESQSGSDSIGLLCDGISHMTKLRFGNASLLYNAAVVLAALIFARGSIGIGTIAYALLGGYFIDFYRFLFAPLALGEAALPIRIFAFCVGQLFMSLGFAVLIQLKLGMSALDALLYKAEQRFHIPYAVIKTTLDISYVIAGTLMGGTFGPGTIVSVLLTGFMVSRLVKMLNRIGALQCAVKCDHDNTNAEY